MMHDVVFQKLILSPQDLLGETVTAAVGVVPKAVKGPLDSQPGGAAEIIDQVEQFGVAGFGCRRARQETLGPRTGGGDGIEFRTDFDEAAQQHLLAFKLRSETEPRVEQTAGQSAAGSRCVTEMFGEPWVRVVELGGAKRQKLPWIPPGVEHPRFESCFESLGERQLRVQHGGAPFKMRIQG